MKKIYNLTELGENRNYLARVSKQEAYLRACGFMVASICPLNDVCDSYLSLAVHELKWFIPDEELPNGYDEMTDEEQIVFKRAWVAKHSWYKQGIKKWGNLARKAMTDNLNSYKLRVPASVSDTEYEFHDQYESKLKPYMDALYWSIRNALTKAGYPASVSHLLSKLEIAEVLLGQVCGLYDEAMREFCKLCRSDFSPTFISLKPMVAYRSWGQAMKLVTDKIDGESFDLNKDKDISIAVAGLYEQIRSVENVNWAEQEALLKCPMEGTAGDKWKNDLKEKLEEQLNG